MPYATYNPKVGALFIDTKNPHGDSNRPCIVDNTCVGAAPNIAWRN